MSKAGCPYDNSCMESFFASFKKKHFYRNEYATINDVKRDVLLHRNLLQPQTAAQQAELHEPGGLQTEKDGINSLEKSMHMA